MTNLEWVRTLNVEQLVSWYYDFWQKEQYKYNHSRNALTWWLQQERQEQDSNKCNDYTTPLEPVKPRKPIKVEVVTLEEQEHERNNVRNDS